MWCGGVFEKIQFEKGFKIGFLTWESHIKTGQGGRVVQVAEIAPELLVMHGTLIEELNSIAEEEN